MKFGILKKFAAFNHKGGGGVGSERKSLWKRYTLFSWGGCWGGGCSWVGHFGGGCLDGGWHILPPSIVLLWSIFSSSISSSEVTWYGVGAWEEDTEEDLSSFRASSTSGLRSLLLIGCLFPASSSHILLRHPHPQHARHLAYILCIFQSESKYRNLVIFDRSTQTC